ncbi:zinc finger and BTB domain-containing protein 21 [Protopterus annectens]|uniref:zinc finger and BTB domain-containing protein 21 n=1 Tax=Protopterus annectens TaxID=7888 RepID=UPI001CF954AC|nr:zinc finger and BTB domain-containing protein 21 [Protopterus annectens]
MEGLLHYINPAHSISLLSSLNEQRLKGQLCDVVLIVGDQKFRAHKNVLAASSEYFHSLFTKKENESLSVFQVDFCESDAFDNVLTYLYSSSLIVEKGGLAAVQELGYSLGISFLTNILSKTPQGPYFAGTSKKVLADDDNSASQQRSVIVCQSQTETQEKKNELVYRDAKTPHLSINKIASDRPQATKPNELPPAPPLTRGRYMKESSTLASAKFSEFSKSLDDQSIPGSGKRNAASTQTAISISETSEESPVLSDATNKGKHLLISTNIPLLPSALSFHSSSKAILLPKGRGKASSTNQGGDGNVPFHSELMSSSSTGVSECKGIDRSGPLVKSLLRRSLSMDSEVPLSSVAFETKATPAAAVSSSSPTETSEAAGSDKEKACTSGKAESLKPRRLRSFTTNQATEKKDSSSKLQQEVKNEPPSPHSEPKSPPTPDPSEIIQVTVGGSSPATTHESYKSLLRIPYKRRLQTDRRLSFKRTRNTSELPGRFQESSSSSSLDTGHSISDQSREEHESEEANVNKKFKCRNCIKIFRSTAGLNRHVNMYHNPEKPYSCDICYKRFHTNFKVWTHCQTQHGIVKNPSPASGASGNATVLDEKYQRKLTDIVREREIKKALIAKLRRGRHGLQGQSISQASHIIKKNFKSRNKGAYICTYCGKLYRFLSQFRQHLKMHSGEKAGENSRPIKPKISNHTEQTEERLPYECRLCHSRFSSLTEHTHHERLCSNATVCPYCSLRFSNPQLKQEHKAQCEYKKLTCLECLRTFKSSFSIWRHQVEVHNQNTMAPTENLSLPLTDHNGDIPSTVKVRPAESSKMGRAASSKDVVVFNDSTEQVNFDSEDSSCIPEDLSLSKHFNILVKDEPADDLEDDVSESSVEHKDVGSNTDQGIWTCEKCGKIFTVLKQLERHQELLCSVKPFVCHICNKAFRTNFRLWSHFQTHLSQGIDEHTSKEPDPHLSSSSPSPPPGPPPPPPPPPIPPLEPDSPPRFSPKNETNDKLFAPQESDTLFYHAPPLSAITFKRQYMCKLCHRTFKTAFSLWSHEQTHT